MEHYRHCPPDFFKLSEVEQESYLNECCGPEDGYVFKFNRDGSIPDFDDSEKIVLDSIRDHSQNGKWKIVGILMEFFGIKSVGPSGVNILPMKDPLNFHEFIKVFPIGCFPPEGVPIYGFSNHIQEWMYGQPKSYLATFSIFNSAFVTQEIFDEIIGAIRRTVYFTKDIHGILTQLSLNEGSLDGLASGSMRDIVVEYLRRRDIWLFEISQKHFKPCNSPKDLYPYAFLMGNPKSLDETADSELRPSYGYAIPKPMWNRQSHRSVTNPQFQREALVVLQMHKFRRDEFPLHKDLIDTVLWHLFEMHLEDMEQRVLDRNELCMTLRNGSADDRLKFGLKYGICIADWLEPDNQGFDYVLDAVHLSIGIPLDISRISCYEMHLYHVLHARSVIDFKSVYKVLECGKAILIYAKEHDIDLYDILSHEMYHYRFVFDGQRVVSSLRSDIR